jgi:hypothetical protein
MYIDSVHRSGVFAKIHADRVCDLANIGTNVQELHLQFAKFFFLAAAHHIGQIGHREALGLRNSDNLTRRMLF